MSAILPGVRSLVRALLEGADGDNAVDAPLQAAEQILRRLAERMTPLVGAGGFLLLLQRALQRARVEHGWLDSVEVEQQEPWRLRSMSKAARDVAPEQALAAAQAILAELIGLIARFLGADMAIRMVRQSVPEMKLEKEQEEGPEETIHE